MGLAAADDGSEPREDAELERMQHERDHRYEALTEVARNAEYLPHVVVGGVEVGYEQVEINAAKSDGADQLERVDANELECQRFLELVFAFLMCASHTRSGAMLLFRARKFRSLVRSGLDLVQKHVQLF